jgi:hypothetical protein
VLGRPIATVIRRIQVEDGPGRRRIAGRIDRDVGAGMGIVAANKEDDRKPRVGGRIKVAAGVAGKLRQPLIKKHVDIERTSHDLASGAVDREGGVHRLNDEPIALAQPLIGRLELSAEIGNGAVQAADTVEVLQQLTGVMVIQWGSSGPRCIACSGRWAASP